VKPRYKWQPMRPAVIPAPSETHIAEWIKSQPGMTKEEVIAFVMEYEKDCTYWCNDLYQVQVRPLPEIRFVHLNIRRRDGGPILRDWRHFQQIKNELVGPECEAIELYPAESRLVDQTNKYHLYACTDPAFRFPIGWTERDVSYVNGSLPGTRQRPL